MKEGARFFRFNLSGALFFLLIFLTALFLIFEIINSRYSNKQIKFTQKDLNKNYLYTTDYECKKTIEKIPTDLSLDKWLDTEIIQLQELTVLKREIKYLNESHTLARYTLITLETGRTEGILKRKDNYIEFIYIYAEDENNLCYELINKM